MRKIAAFLKYSFGGIITSAKRFLWPFYLSVARRNENDTESVLSIARQMCLKEHSLNLTESKTNNLIRNGRTFNTCASTVNELI